MTRSTAWRVHTFAWIGGLAGAACLMLTPDARADVFTLSNGGSVTGTLVNSKEPGRAIYEIRTSSGIQLKLDRAQVAKVATQRAVEEDYAKIKGNYADTPEAQWELAEWCRERNLSNQRKEHLQRVIALDPSQENARRALGYMKYNGKWMTQVERMEANGYVRYRGQWQLPQQVELLEKKDKQDRAEKEWFRKLRMYRTQFDDPAKAMAATERIRTIDDPNAVRALGDYLKEEPQWQVRKLYVEALGNMKSLPAFEVMVLRSVVDEHDEVRYTAMDYFPEKDPDIVTMYLRLLKHKDNTVINRAAEGLKKLKHPAAIAPLIDVLITQHRFRVTQGSPGGMSMTFGTGGASGANSGVAPVGGGTNGMGFSAGGTTKEYIQYLQNVRVLEALVELSQTNYHFDVKSWKLWLDQQRSPKSAGERRD